MSIYEIIQSIADIGSTKAKQAICEANKDNEVLKNCFLYAENPRFNFYIKVGMPSSADQSGTNDISMSTFTQLDKLINREYTGNAARQFVAGMMTQLWPDAQVILARIINKDLRCNCGTSIANKVWDDLIPEYPVMLASKGDAKSMKHLAKFENKAGFIVQKKCDGGRVIVTVSDAGEVTYRSRNGNVLNLYGVFDNVFAKSKGMVFDGEVLVRTASGIADRKVGNGLYTKAVRGTLSDVEVKSFCMEVWDIVPESEYNSGLGIKPYELRLEALYNAGFNSEIVKVVDSLKVATLAECFAYYDTMRSEGEEGAIIKVADSLWEDKRSKGMVKLKADETADLICVGWEKGTGKNANKIGNLILQTSDGLLETGCGTGLSDADRERNPEDYLGKIIETGYNEVIASKDPKKTTKSLFLPVFKQIRYDKNVANKLSELK